MKRNLPGRFESAYASPCQPKPMLCSGEIRTIPFLSQLKPCTHLPIQRGKSQLQVAATKVSIPPPRTPTEGTGAACSQLKPDESDIFRIFPIFPQGLGQDPSQESLGNHAPQHKPCLAGNDTLLIAHNYGGVSQS